MEYIKKDIDNIKIHLVKTRKFKTNHISIKFINKFEKSTVSKRTLLAKVLKNSCDKFKTKKELQKQLEFLYGSSVSSNVTRYGLTHVISFSSVYPNDKLLNTDLKLTNEILGLLNDIIYNPFLEKDGFNNKALEEERSSLIDIFDSEKEDKIKYSISRLVKLMCKDEIYSTKSIGILEDIKKITSKELYSYYTQLLKNTEIQIVLCGDFEDDIFEKVSSKFKFDKPTKRPIFIDTETKTIKNIETIFEKENVQQGKLNIGYRVNTFVTSDDYYPMLILSSILGGGVHSKLFNQVREKNSLAYYASNAYDSHKGIMFIYCGIDVSNYSKALKVIDQQIIDIKNGSITKTEIESSKKSIINSLNELYDSQSAIAARCFYLDLKGSSFETKPNIDNIMNVTIEDIVNVAQKIEKDTIYFLSGADKDGII